LQTQNLDMNYNASGFKGKSLAIIFTLMLLISVAMIVLTFIKPDARINRLSSEIDAPIDQVWTCIYDKKLYLATKKEIIKSTIYDSIKPRWVEFYTPSDSVENVAYKVEKNRLFTYTIINRKYEQVNGIAIRLDKINEKKTKVTIVECSQYFNSWASIYFQLFHPNTVVDYELVKIKNTLTSLTNPIEND
jgi:hypothetical protein